MALHSLAARRQQLRRLPCLTLAMPQRTSALAVRWRPTYTHTHTHTLHKLQPARNAAHDSCAERYLPVLSAMFASELLQSREVRTRESSRSGRNKQRRTLQTFTAPQGWSTSILNFKMPHWIWSYYSLASSHLIVKQAWTTPSVSNYRS